MDVHTKGEMLVDAKELQKKRKVQGSQIFRFQLLLCSQNQENLQKHPNLIKKYMYISKTPILVVFSLLAELVVLILKLTAPVGLSIFLQVVSLIPMLARRMKAMAPPTLMSGILRFDDLVRVGRAGKLLVVGSTVTLLL